MKKSFTESDVLKIINIFLKERVIINDNENRNSSINSKIEISILDEGDFQIDLNLEKEKRELLFLSTFENKVQNFNYYHNWQNWQEFVRDLIVTLNNNFKGYKFCILKSNKIQKNVSLKGVYIG